MSSVFSFLGGSATIVSGEAARGLGEWRALFREQYKDARYYEIIEETLDFSCRYIVVRDEQGTVRGIQPFLLVQQNLVEGIPGGLRRAIDSLRRRFPKFLTMRVLMIGCAAGEGHLGNISEGADWLARALHKCLPAIARAQRASLIVLKDFPSHYREALSAFSNNGFTRVPSMPMTRLALKDLRDFDEYLSRLSYGTRKSLRRKFRKTDRAAHLALEVTTDLTPFLDEVYPLYLAVHERSAMKFETLTKDYLGRLGREMPERVRFFLWRLEKKIVAFSVCFVHEGTLYDEYLGLDYGVAHQLNLYFYTIKDILSWAIEYGLSFYCSSPLNYDPKLHLGCELAPLDLYVRHTANWLNPIFGRVVKLLEPTRHDPVLKKFPNAAELA